MKSTLDTPAGAPWWKFGYMWLVLSGPAIVVVAGFYTFYLAVKTPDPVYSDAPRGAVVRTMPNEPGAGALVPARDARNHAATGGVAAKP